MKTVYYNAKVYNGRLPLEEAFAVDGGKFIACGKNADVLALASDADEKIDLNGQFVCAGFNDSHMHLFNYGVALGEALLAPVTDSLKGILDCLKEFCKGRRFDDTNWLIGRGWNQDYFTDVKRIPSRWDLDEVSTEFPIIIVRACCHCGVVNSKALELIGIDENTPSPEGGCIGKEDGVLDGRLYDNALELAYSKIPVPGKEEVKRCIEAACKALNSYGVTSSQTDDYPVYRALPWSVVNEAYRELAAEGKLTVRVYEQSNFTNVKDLTEFIEAGCVTGAGDEMFKIGPLKMLGDGALGPRTAFISVPYADDPSAVGIPVFSQQQLIDMIDCAVGHGMQVAVHAIGDACLDYVLNAYEAAFEKYHPADHRCGIVHCQITRPEQLERIARLKLHVYAQSIFLDYDINMVEDRVGPELVKTSYCWKTLMKNGVCVSNGTDCPVELPFALEGIQCAVTRKTCKGVGPYLPEEAFTVQEALDSYTSASAHASFEENIKGRIEPGMLADFVVLDVSPFDVDPMNITKINVMATYLGGRKVFGSN